MKAPVCTTISIAFHPAKSMLKAIYEIKRDSLVDAPKPVIIQLLIASHVLNAILVYLVDANTAKTPKNNLNYMIAPSLD
jgi:hypothetical protein